MAVLSLSAEWSSLCEGLRQVVAASPGRTLRIRCAQIARKVGLSGRRIRSIYEGGVQVDQVGWEEAERLRRYLDEARQAQAARAAAAAQLDRAYRRFRADAGGGMAAGGDGSAPRARGRKAVAPG